MQRYIALLGGINVGGHRVKMDALRQLFEALGFDHVSTFIASGNVIFESTVDDTALMKTRIEQQLKESLGYPVPTFIRSAAEMASVAGYVAFPKLASETRFYILSVLFFNEALPGDLQQKLAGFQTPADEFHVHQREIYWLCYNKTSESLVDWPRLNKAVSMPPATTRNITTVRKLAEIVTA
jgi:uncharacterized protein (DUF1697 family)